MYIVNNVRLISVIPMNTQYMFKNNLILCYLTEWRDIKKDLLNELIYVIHEYYFLSVSDQNNTKIIDSC